MDNKQASQPRRVRINLSPISIVASVIIIVLVFGIFSSFGGQEITQLTVSDFISGIKNNRFSRLTLQNSGEILTQEKYIFTSAGGTGIEGVVKLQEIDEEELVELFTEKDPIQQLKDFVATGAPDAIDEIIIGDTYAILRDSAEDGTSYIYRGITEVSDLESVLKDNEIVLADLPVTLSKLESASATLATESFTSRVEEDAYQQIFEVNGLYIARIANEDIPTFSIQWDAGIGSSLRILQEEDISLSSNNFEVAPVIVASVPWGDIISLITLIGFIVLGYFIFRGIQNSGSGLMKFGQSKARMFWGVKPDITFDDVAGVDEAKNELQEIVQFLKTPEKFRKLGARIPKGVLMVGRPGTGKTLLARAVAGEAGVPFFHTSGSEFEEMLVGAGASRVRDLFEKAQKASPSLIFIDEIDAVARKRGTTIQSGTTEQTLNQILVEMDGFENETNVIVIAATNRPDVLDPAILRPGRFDRRVVLDLPDVKGREQILAVHAEGKPMDDTVKLSNVAKRTIGFSGAELENTLNEAAIIAAKADHTQISAQDIEEAASKVMMGPIRRSIVRSDEELNLVAVHEAGHAVVAHYMKKADLVHRVSILSRGSAGGVTHFLPEDDNRMMGKNKLFARIVVGLGGRAAEEIVLEDISTGASSDIESVTNTARAMIQRFGMSKQLGLIKYGDSDDSLNMGYGYGGQEYSEDTAKLIDNEIRSLVDEAYVQAKAIINKNKDKFDVVVSELLKHEVLEAEEFAELLEGADKKAQNKETKKSESK